MTPHGTSPVFVGRSSELAALLATGGEVGSEGARTVLVAGDAGVGKTRLLQEFTTRTPMGRVVSGGCLELGVEGLPFAPFTTVLRQLHRELGQASFDELAAGGEQELARLLPELGPPPAQRHEARGRLFEQVLRLFSNTARGNGLTVVLEDLHWADSATRDLLVFLVRNLDTAAVQIVASYRSDDLHREHPLRWLLPELRRLPTVSRLELPPFSAEEVAEQAEAIKGSALDPADLKLLYERSAGNPLFVESFLDCLDTARHSLPDRPRELLLGALRNLDDAARFLVKIASVGGNRVGDRLLAKVADLADHEFDTALYALVDANILRVRDTDYVFRHALLRDAVHAGLMPGQHSRLHLRFADIIEANPGLMAPDRVTAELAHHFHAAHELPRALSAAWWAADSAGKSLAYAEQARMLERVIELWDRVPDPAALIGVGRVKVLCRTTEAAIATGDPQRAKDLADDALSELPADPDDDDEDDAARRATLLRHRGRARVDLVDPGAVHDFRAALAALPPDDTDYAWALASLSRELMLRPAPAEAVALADEAIRRGTESGDDSAVAEAMITRGTLLGQSGDISEAMDMIEHAIELARSVNEPALEVRGLANVASFHQDYGRERIALDFSEAGIERADDLSLLRSTGACMALGKAEIQLSLGEFAQCRATVRTALGWSPTPLYRRFFSSVDGLAALAQGDLATAAASCSPAGIEFAHAQQEFTEAQLSVGVRLAEGDPRGAAELAMRVVARPEIAVLCANYGWPMLRMAAVAVHTYASTVDDDTDGFLASARGMLRETFDSMPLIGPVQSAERADLIARLADIDGATPEHSRQEWDAAVAEWSAVERPYPRAQALLAAAESAAAAGDRTGTAERLRDAADLAKEIGAQPLEARIADLARRTNVSLDGSPAAPPPAEPAGLTRRETEVLRLLTRGYSNAQIAGELFIAVKTASVHVSNILAKLDVPHRGAAAARARELGMR